MTKFRLYFNKDRETEWLNEMARRGYAMTGFVGGFYSFDPCQPGEYMYQIDVAEGIFKVSNDYREFMREAGVEIVCLWGMWVILRRKAAEGTFVLYTDVESSITHYTKIKRTFSVIMVIESLCLCMELFAFTMGRKMEAFGFSLMIAAFLIVLFRELMRVNYILDDLKGRIGQASCRRRGIRRPSIFIPVGLLMNALACAVPVQNIGSNGVQYGFLKGFFQGIALIFLLVGLVLNVRQRRD